MNVVHRAAAGSLLWLGLVTSALPGFAQGSLQGLPRRTLPDTTTSLGAHARYSKAPINMDTPPNLTLAVALVTAGGGSAAFDTHRLVSSLMGSEAAARIEEDALGKNFGPANVTSFEKTFTFLTRDALERVTEAGMSLPATTATTPDPRAVATSLYTAGVMPNGKFDAEYMLDALVTHIVHVHVMSDVDAAPDLGPTANANAHLILFQVMMDVKKLYAL